MPRSSSASSPHSRGASATAAGSDAGARGWSMLPAVSRPRSPFQPHLVALDCPACGASTDLAAPRSTCPTCGQPLVARYDLARIRAEVPRDALARFGTDLWRYRAVLPFAHDFAAVRLGEGGTPLLPMPRLG